MVNYAKLSIFSSFVVLLLLVGCNAEIDRPQVDVVCPQCPDCVCPDIPECPEAEAADCEEAETVTQYVCADGTVESTVEACLAEPVYDFVPITTNEVDSLISTAAFTPTCVNGNDGGSIYYKLDRVPREVELQVKTDPSENFVTLYTSSAAVSNYLYFAICPYTCYLGDFEIDTNKVYLMRLMFDFGSTKGGVQYSNEYIIDTQAGADYRGQGC